MPTPVTQINYPPLDSQATETFITDNVTDPSGDNVRDFRQALFNVLEANLPAGSKPNSFSIDDLWKRYLQFVISTDTDNENPWNPADTPDAPFTGFPGMPPALYFPPGILNNPGNAKGFPAGGVAPVERPTDTDALSFAQVFDGCSNPNSWSAIWNDDGTRLYSSNSANSTMNYNTTPAAFSTPYTGEDVTAAAFIDNGVTTGTRTLAWNGDGTEITAYGTVADEIATYELETGVVPYNPESGGGNGTIKPAKATLAAAAPTGGGFANDGNSIYYVSNDAGRDVFQAALSTPYDISTAGAFSEWEPSIGDIRDFKFFGDGSWGFVLGFGTELVYLVDFSTPWDITTATIDTSKALDVSGDVPGSEIPVTIIPPVAGRKELFINCFFASGSSAVLKYTW